MTELEREAQEKYESERRARLEAYRAANLMRYGYSIA